MILEKKKPLILSLPINPQGRTRCHKKALFLTCSCQRGKKPRSRKCEVIHRCSFISESCPLDCLWHGWLSWSYFLPSSCPKKTALQPCTLALAFVPSLPAALWQINSELSFKTGPGITACRKPTLTEISFSPCSRYTFYFHYSIYHTLNYTLYYLSFFFPLLLFVSKPPLGRVPGTKYTTRWVNKMVVGDR